MARTRRLALWRQLCCASLATLLAVSICAALLRCLMASGSPLTGMQDQTHRTAVMHVTVIQATPATPAESIAPAMLKPERTHLADTRYGKRVYLPAGKLSQRPLILQDIEPMLTDASQSSSEARLTLRLLINEYGDVDQVLPEDATLPASIVSELQQRFLHARFLPGRLQGLAVASALRIVVTLHTPSEFSGE